MYAYHHRRGATQTIAFVPVPVRADRESEKGDPRLYQALPNNQAYKLWAEKRLVQVAW